MMSNRSLNHSCCKMNRSCFRKLVLEHSKLELVRSMSVLVHNKLVLVHSRLELVRSMSVLEHSNEP